MARVHYVWIGVKRERGREGERETDIETEKERKKLKSTHRANAPW